MAVKVKPMNRLDPLSPASFDLFFRLTQKDGQVLMILVHTIIKKVTAIKSHEITSSVT